MKTFIRIRSLLRNGLLAGVLPSVALAQVLSVDSAMRTTMTLYANAAIVRHTFETSVGKGETQLRLERLTDMLSPTTLMLRSNTVGVTVNSLTLQQPTATANDVLQTYVGRTIVLRQRSGIVEGELLVPPTTMVGGNDPCYVGAILRTRSGELLVSPCGELMLPTPAPTLTLSPTLSATVRSSTTTPATFDVVYQCDGLQWEASYSAVLLDDRQFQLDGRLHVLNATRSTFRCNQLQVVAGSVNIRRKYMRSSAEYALTTRAMASSDAEPAPEQERLDAYHLYTVPGGATITPNSTTTLMLRQAITLPYVRRYMVRGRWYPAYHVRENDSVMLPVENVVEFTAALPDSEPLPAGTVRVWRRDSRGTLQLLGEDDISHTPAGEKVALSIGDVSDMRAVRREINYKRLTDRAADYTVEYTIRNSSTSSRTVSIVESFAGAWTITESTIPFEKRSSSRAEFRVVIPAGSSATFRYTVRHSW
ncbi:MAG: hypothetical protein N2663_02325 [Chlorobi bacterium]|nr:hypothetical protein [Chlorobiota bacterium]